MRVVQGVEAIDLIDHKILKTFQKNRYFGFFKGTCRNTAPTFGLLSLFLKEEVFRRDSPYELKVIHRENPYEIEVIRRDSPY